MAEKTDEVVGKIEKAMTTPERVQGEIITAIEIVHDITDLGYN